MLREGLSLCSFSGDLKIPLIHGLSVLELSVLVASRHATELNQCEPINFEMIFDGNYTTVGTVCFRHFIF